MEWRRSILVTLLPLPAGGRSLPRARNGLAAGQLCFCRRPFFTGGQCCPGQRNGLAAAQGQHIGGVLCPGQGNGQGQQDRRRPAGGGNFALGKGSISAAGQSCCPLAAVNSAFTGRRSLPWAAQGGGQSCCCPLRPANSAQGSISAAFFAQGKGMGKGSAAGGQLCLCRPAVLCLALLYHYCYIDSLVSASKLDRFLLIDICI